MNKVKVLWSGITGKSGKEAEQEAAKDALSKQAKFIQCKYGAKLLPK